EGGLARRDRPGARDPPPRAAPRARSPRLDGLPPGDGRPSVGRAAVPAQRAGARARAPDRADGGDALAVRADPEERRRPRERVDVSASGPTAAHRVRPTLGTAPGEEPRGRETLGGRSGDELETPASYGRRVPLQDRYLRSSADDVAGESFPR